MDAMDLQKKVRSRDTHISVVQKIINTDLRKLYREYGDSNFTLATTLKNTVEHKIEKILALNEEILEIMEKDENFEDSGMVRHIEESTHTEINLKNELLILQRFIKSKDHDDYSSQSSSSRGNSVKLPKMVIKKFDGDPTNWSTFIDMFEATIDENTSLSNVEKMTYLVSYLVKDAANTVSGLKLSHDNYEVALDLLKQRYGDPQLVISFAYDEIINT